MKPTSILAAIAAIFSHLIAFFRGRQSGKRSEYRAAAKDARKRGDSAAIRDVIKRSHGD